ncbi:7425_t:CDS:2, partial [Dentiscutata erythropus]
LQVFEDSYKSSNDGYVYCYGNIDAEFQLHLDHNHIEKSEMLRTLAVSTGVSTKGLELTMYSYMFCLVASVTGIIRAISKEMLGDLQLPHTRREV